MNEIWKIIKFIWWIMWIPIAVTIALATLFSIISIILDWRGYNESAYKIGKFAVWWWKDKNGRWCVMVIATILTLLVAGVKTVFEFSPLNWEVRQTMSDKDSKLNKITSYLWVYIKGEKIEKEEDILLNIKKPSLKSNKGVIAGIPRPTGPEWWIKFCILLFLTFIYMFKAWLDKICGIWKEWRRRSTENKKARVEKKEEPHNHSGFFDYFIPSFAASFIAEIVNNAIGEK